MENNIFLGISIVLSAFSFVFVIAMVIFQQRFKALVLRRSNETDKSIYEHNGTHKSIGDRMDSLQNLVMKASDITIEFQKKFKIHEAVLAKVEPGYYNLRKEFDADIVVGREVQSELRNLIQAIHIRVSEVEDKTAEVPSGLGVEIKRLLEISTQAKAAAGRAEQLISNHKTRLDGINGRCDSLNERVKIVEKIPTVQPVDMPKGFYENADKIDKAD